MSLIAEFYCNIGHPPKIIREIGVAFGTEIVYSQGRVRWFCLVKASSEELCMLTLGRLDGFSSQRIQALLGLKTAALSALLSKALPALVGHREQVKATRPGRKRAPGGGRKRKLQPYQEVLLTLIYLRHNVSHEVVGALFGVSADTSENTFHEVVLVLREVCPSEAWDAEKRWKKGDPTWQLVRGLRSKHARPS